MVPAALQSNLPLYFSGTALGTPKKTGVTKIAKLKSQAVSSHSPEPETLPLCRNTRKFTKARFTMPIIQEHGAPVACDACLRHLSEEIEIAEKNRISQYGKVLLHPLSVFHLALYLPFEFDTEGLPPPNGSYIFCPDRQQLRKIAVFWPDHRVTPQPPLVALQVSVVFCSWTGTSSHLLAQSKAQEGESG